MTLNQLSQTLHEMYSNARKGEQVTNIYLFGIKYYQEIKNLGTRGFIKEIINQAGLRSSYHTELSKAVKLGKYVLLK